MQATLEALTNFMVNTGLPFLSSLGGKLVSVLIVWVVGDHLIKLLVRTLQKSKGLGMIEATVRTFTISFVRIGLYVLLFITLISIMGVPMSSVVAVVASAAAAVGLAMQGALSNLAGGIMLLISRPFKQGDYIEAAGVAGIVREISLVYTVLVTPDGKRITVPNGTLMNANIVDYSAEEYRRVDFSFTCAKTEDPETVRQVLLANAVHPLIAPEKDPPAAWLMSSTDTAMQFSLRVWVKTPDYWTVFFELNPKLTEALLKAGIQAPVVRVLTDEKNEKNEKN